jgi:uncharacterized membrane protein YeaQ/YmgE (transglycosylase-associated protein family)
VTLAFILFILLWGLVVGGLARLAVPGPDPMPIWLTIAIGIGGSLIGGIVTRIFFGTGVSFFFAFLGALLLVILHRRYVQHRPIAEPGARQPPQ